jgi:glutamine cyclotransferase
MEDNDLVVQADRYHALCAMEGRVNALVDLIRAKKELTTNDALIILGYEPEEDNLVVTHKKWCTGQEETEVGDAGESEE